MWPREFYSREFDIIRGVEGNLEEIFYFSFNTENPFIREHRVKGIAVVPGIFIIEGVMQAVLYLWCNKKVENTPWKSMMIGIPRYSPQRLARPGDKVWGKVYKKIKFENEYWLWVNFGLDDTQDGSLLIAIYPWEE